MAKIRSRAERTPQENEAISKKVELLLSEGYKIDQATAIAFRMFRDGELNILKETSQTYKRQREKKKSHNMSYVVWPGDKREERKKIISQSMNRAGQTTWSNSFQKSTMAQMALSNFERNHTFREDYLQANSAMIVTSPCLLASMPVLDLNKFV